MNYLLDTDIMVYWLNNTYPAIQDRIETLGNDQVSISSITVAELYFGAYNSSRENENIQLLGKLFSELRIWSFDEKCGKFFGKIKSLLKRNGQIVNDSDLFIASIALSNNLCLVTNNVRHFSRIEELKIENWAS